MFKLIKGNPDNLKGKVLVFAYSLDKKPSPFVLQEFNSPHEQIIYPAVYSSPTLENVLSFGASRLNLSEEGKIAIERQLKEILDEEANDSEKENLEKRCPYMRVISSYNIPINFKSLDDIMVVDSDILHVGDISNLNAAYPILSEIAQNYIITYSAQQESRPNADKILESIKKDSVAIDNYAMYAPEQLRKKLCDFSWRLIDSVLRKEQKQEIESTNSLKAFMQNAPFYNDVTNLIDTARSNYGFGIRINLMTMYIEKIVAVCAEKYEEADVFKKKIEDLQKASNNRL